MKNELQRIRETWIHLIWEGDMIKGNLLQSKGSMQEKSQYNRETRTKWAISPQTATAYQQQQNMEINGFF